MYGINGWLYIKKHRNVFLIALAFAFPVLCLLVFTIVNEYQLRSGQTVVLPIEGHDPRDLLSGRYLHYKILYGTDCLTLPSIAKTKIPGVPHFLSKKQKAYLCLKPQMNSKLSLFVPKNCSLFIKGQCRIGQKEFYAGGDRLYIPDLKAKNLEKIFQQATKKEVLLWVAKNGRVLAKDILIDEKSLKNTPWPPSP